ncbi:phosphatase PAP2 family protein [Nocardioides sp. CER19]|uniref:phosphatase PAP2 family protein n=1 Tax=Nocardioides sp. CER19 TaxID=3038538 RepID=UPI00244C33DE|nr:phosphatase PAP2 family protein [Nocardioides sp. CER19]MDH2416322.1 phosphatase PAP2 family protein [Nocardioides sp. CER19]
MALLQLPCQHDAVADTESADDVRRRASRASRIRPGARELAVLGLLYVAYSLVRVLASDDLVSAASHAADILHLEQMLHLDVERWLNDFFYAHHVLEVGASFYYAAAHYLVTPAVLFWLWRRHRAHYLGARRALAGASLVALALFLIVPTEPPRLFGGYHDLLALTADVGWWSTSASAPQGLGDLTNQLAAMPSMHVGWALWCALVVATCARSRILRIAGWAHPLLTALVVVGTGNHWILDAVVGAAIVLVAWTIYLGNQRPRLRWTNASHAT